MSKLYNTFFIVLMVTLLVTLFTNAISYAAPFGDGYYGTHVPYGDLDSLTISNSGNVNIAITPSATTTSTFNSATGTVTVVSTDVVGYNLYLRTVGGAALQFGTKTIASSSNVSEAALAVNTWGFNTDGTTNFIGPSGTDSLLTSFSGPADTGNTTSVTYGVSVDRTVQAGTYTTTVLYTAVPQTN
jgi:hypothetical protein